MPGALAQPVKTPDLTARCVSTSQDILIPTARERDGTFHQPREDVSGPYSF